MKELFYMHVMFVTFEELQIDRQGAGSQSVFDLNSLHIG